jgi:cell wall-associated NlpC family hydrolase
VSDQDTSTAPMIAIGLAAAALAVLIGFVAVVGGVSGDQSAAMSLTAAVLQASQACTPSGPVPGLSPSQAGYADQTVAATFADSGENQTAAQIAVMVALTESGLQNLGPRPGNAGSLGLFQQRVSQGWGTAPQEMDPPAATGMFVERLIATPDWQAMAPWLAAQSVQRSAFAFGQNYQANWAQAGAILTAVLSNGNTAGTCGQGVSGGITGPASSFGLPPGYTVPPGTGPEHAEVVDFAIAQLGKPYVWAAAGPNAYDCSGLTMAAWVTAGVTLDHYTVSQQSEGVAATVSDLMAGDLVLTPGSDSPGPGEAGHVGIYLGYGLVESAIDPQMGVEVQSWQTFISGGLDALRDPASADG